jgi:hypothetical protein
MNMLDDVEFQIAKLSLGPDDLLAVRAAKPLTSVMAAHLRAQLERQFDLAGRVLVIDAGVELSVVTSAGTKPEGGQTKPGEGADAAPRQPALTGLAPVAGDAAPPPARAEKPRR